MAISAMSLDSWGIGAALYQELLCRIAIASLSNAENRNPNAGKTHTNPASV